MQFSYPPHAQGPALTSPRSRRSQLFTEFPPAIENLKVVLEGMSLNIDVASPQCAVSGTSYYTKFLATIAMLCLVMLVLMAGPLTAVAKNAGKKGLRTAFREATISDQGSLAFHDAFVVVLLLHPSVSGTAMQFFRCRSIDGVHYLMADYSIECFDSTWLAYLIIVVPVLLIFSLGMPLLIAYVLYVRRKTLYKEDGTVEPHPLDILYAIYLPHAYWYESVQMIFKLALYATLVAFDYQSEMQLATALVVNVMQLCVHIFVLPMSGDDLEDSKLQNVLQACTLVLTTQVMKLSDS